jgi:hypothetical protein
MNTNDIIVITPVAVYFSVIMMKPMVYTYEVIYGAIYMYEVIMRNFRASMEPFRDLKISKYVEYLTSTSREYFISSVLPSLTSTAGRISRVLLDYVIPWINKASLVLYGF